jgi:diguanylate cyclase (GGDEF)-like protein
MVTGGFVLLSGGLVRRWFQRQVQDQAHINWLLEHDYLTRLNNRNSFIEQAEKNLSQGRPFYIVHISVSNLKHTAKIHGHSIAESLLQAIAERLLKLLPEQALAARSIGTDFLLLLPEQQVDEVDDFGYRLMQELSAAYNVQGFRHELRPYIGISYSVTDGESVNELLQAADIATVQTRQQETAIQHYHPALSKEIKDKHAQVQALQDAIGRSAVEIIYQPKVCLQSRRIVGFEALSRLQGVDKNLQSPVVFIPLAEETGLIKPLGYLVLLKAIKQLAQWRDKGHMELTMAINLSPLQLDDEKLPYYIKQLCQRYGIPPQRVELELTESNFVQGQHPTLNCLRQFGFKLSVDDFGVGYSNLGYMVSLQPQQIKIDRSFVCNLEEDMNKQAVVNALTTLAEGMDIQLVAEGIESEAQLELLCRMGIHVGQGYLFSRPVAWHEAELLMQPAIARAG